MTENEMKVKLHKIIAENSKFTTWTISTPHIMMLVQQAIEEEREACCSGEVVNAANINGADNPHQVVAKYQAAIRARGNT